MKPNISNVAFWDVDFSKIDFEKDSIFVIDKVLNNGLWNDQVELIRFYGKDRIRKELKNIPYFRKDILPFITLYFNVKTTELECYMRRQSNQLHWNY